MAIVVNGLVAAQYINNPILVTMVEDTANAQVSYYEVRITNASTLQAQVLVASPDINGQAQIDISQAIKSMFKNPQHNGGVGDYENSGREVFNFDFRCIYFLPESRDPKISTLKVTGRVFIRGGMRGQHFNVAASLFGALRSSDKLPVWPGYPTFHYSFVSNFEIGQFLPSGSYVEYMKKKGCNPVYVKFFNSKGAYSNWLFEGETENENTTNSGYSNSPFANPKIVDFGNEVEESIEVYSKVPVRYFGLIQDLIESPEIYIYDPTAVGDAMFIRVVNNNNKVSIGNFDKVKEVRLQFKKITNYNPQVIW